MKQFKIGILGIILMLVINSCSVPCLVTADTGSKDVCYIDCKSVLTPRIGDFVAPDGYYYLIVTLKLKNESNIPVSTNPYFWSITSNGVTYYHDSVTFYDKYINNQVVEVGKGGEFTTQIVYVVPKDLRQFNINYIGFNKPKFQFDDSLL